MTVFSWLAISIGKAVQEAATSLGPKQKAEAILFVKQRSDLEVTLASREQLGVDWLRDKAKVWWARRAFLAAMSLRWRCDVAPVSRCDLE